MSDKGEQTIHDVYAYLRLHDTKAAIDFYARAFGALHGVLGRGPP